MVNNYILSLAIVALTLPAFAQDQAKGDEPPAPKPKAVYIGRVVIPEADAEATANWTTLTYADLADADDAWFAIKLNAGSPAAKGYGEQADPIRQLQKAAAAGAVLRKAEANWELMRDEQGQSVNLGSASGDLPAGAALRSILGYDAIVIAQRGQTVYAQTPDLSGKDGLYAVAIGDSISSATLKDDPTKVRSALLRLLDSRKVADHGSISRFRVVSSETAEPLSFGVKLRLEAWQ